MFLQLISPLELVNLLKLIDLLQFFIRLLGFIHQTKGRCGVWKLQIQSF